MLIDDNKISVLILFILSGHMSVFFYAYTEFSSVQLNTYSLTKLKKSYRENVNYSHTKLY